MRHRGKGLIASILCLFACAVFVPACTSDAEVAAERAAAVDRREALVESADDAAATIAALSKALADLRAERDDLAVRVDRLAPDDPTRAAADAAIAAISTRLGSMGVSLDLAKSAEVEARSEAAKIAGQIKASDAALADQSVETGANAVGDILGILVPGLAVATPALAGLFAGFWKRGRAKDALAVKVEGKSRAIEKIVNSIDAVIASAPAVRDAFKDPAIRAMIDKIQTPAVKAEVDKAQGKPTAVAS